MTKPYFLTMNDLCFLFRVKRSTINRWNNPNSRAFKPNFPQPLKMSHKPLWNNAEIQAFIDAERKARDEKIAQRLANKAELERHTEKVKQELFAQQKALKEETYIRPPKGDRLSAHTLRKMQAFKLR